VTGFANQASELSATWNCSRPSYNVRAQQRLERVAATLRTIAALVRQNVETRRLRVGSVTIRGMAGTGINLRNGGTTRKSRSASIRSADLESSRRAQRPCETTRLTIADLTAHCRSALLSASSCDLQPRGHRPLTQCYKLRGVDKPETYVAPAPWLLGLLFGRRP
jgi:hypothetical protein